MTEQSGRVAIVTGGSRGIGLAIARRLGGDGIAIVVMSRTPEDVEKAAATLRQEGIAAIGIGGDVGNEDSVLRVFDEIDRRFGRLDILVNNAGISPRDPGGPPSIERATLANWNRTMAVNLTGPFLCSRAAVPLMKRGGWGRIVNISSRTARMGLAGTVYYASTKAGLHGFSRVLAAEVGRHGITVNSVAPSVIATEISRGLPEFAEIEARNVAASALGRLGSTGDVAGAVAFLVSDDAAFMTGGVIDMNGGSFMPA